VIRLDRFGRFPRDAGRLGGRRWLLRSDLRLPFRDAHTPLLGHSPARLDR